jgi:hypothetical protein
LVFVALIPLARPRDIRKLIERNLGELELYGDLPHHGADRVAGLAHRLRGVRRDGVRVLTNSREVAAFFETRHDNVLDARATSRSASRHFITPAKNRSIHQVVEAMAE